MTGPDALISQPIVPVEKGALTRFKVSATAIAIALIALAFLSFRSNRPPNEFWDEILYVRVARALLQGELSSLQQQPSVETFGRQHPPLGPYLIAAGIKVAGDRPLGWRLPGELCGAVTVVAIFLWTLLLLRNYEFALTAAALTLFNNFLFVMGRVAIPDVFMFTFVIWAVLAFTAAIELEITRNVRRLLTVCSGLLFGLAMACKWNAVDSLFTTFALAIGLLVFERRISAQNVRLHRSAVNLRSIGLPALAIAFLVVPVVTYILMFWPLFRVMHTPMSFSALSRTHALMLHLTKAATGNPTQYAAWYSWPFRATPTRALSYLLGNPVVMWGGVIALFACLRRLFSRLSLPETMTIGLYVANLLQWAFTPIKVPNYYYYYPAAMFLGVAIAVALCDAPRQRVFGVRISLLITIAAAAVFLYCYQRMAYLEPPWDCMFGCWS